MSDPTTGLNVSIRDLPSVHAACIRCTAQVDQGQFSQAIRASFQRLQQWVKDRGLDPYTRLTIGAIHLEGTQLSHYDCCVEVLPGTQSSLEEIAMSV